MFRELNEAGSRCAVVVANDSRRRYLWRKIGVDGEGEIRSGVRGRNGERKGRRDIICMDR